MAYVCPARALLKMWRGTSTRTPGVGHTTRADSRRALSNPESASTSSAAATRAAAAATPRARDHASCFEGTCLDHCLDELESMENFGGGVVEVELCAVREKPKTTLEL